jgi:hypothetical protein
VTFIRPAGAGLPRTGGSEDASFRGTLVYTDNRMLEPSLVAAVIIRETGRLRPRVAVQSLYVRPTPWVRRSPASCACTAGVLISTWWSEASGRLAGAEWHRAARPAL